MKKFAAALICAAMLATAVSGASLPADAVGTALPVGADCGVTAAVEPELLGSRYEDDLVSEIGGEKAKELIGILYPVLTSSSEEPVDLTSLHIPHTDGVLQALNNYIWKCFPELFNVDWIGLYYNKDGITSAFAEYNCSAEEYSRLMAQIRTTEKAIIGDLVGNGSLTDVEKALLVHDRLCEICEYDHAVEGRFTHTMAGALAAGKAVCDGYAGAYQYLLTKLGIECEVVISDALNHAWNIVTADGVRYHVDVTWDDRTAYGWAQHDNFLVSTATLVQTGHDARDFDRSPVTDAPAPRFWAGSGSAFQLIDGMLYYIDGDGALRCRCDGIDVVCVEASGRWDHGPFSHWLGNFAHIASEDGRIFYTTPKDVREYVPGEGSRVLFAPAMPDPYWSVCGIRADHGVLYVDVADDPNDSEDNRALYGAAVRFRSVRGDADSDGNVCLKDVSAILKYLAGWSQKYYDPAAADYDQSGYTDASDASALLRDILKG